MAVAPERPQPFQPAPQQLQHVPRGVDVPVPEVCFALTVGTSKTFRVNWSAIFMLTSLAGAPDEWQFDTPQSQSAWIRAPLGQSRLVLVLATPGADRQARSSSVLSRSVVTCRVINEAQSCSIVPALVEARTTKERLDGSDAGSLLRTVVTQEMWTLRYANSFISHSASRGSWSKAGHARLFSPMARGRGAPRDASWRTWRIPEWSRPERSVPPRRQGTRSAHPLQARRHTLAHYSSRIIPSQGKATCCS
jgi:hypothetical protein